MYIYYNLVTEMQAAVAIISVSRSIYNKLSFHSYSYSNKSNIKSVKFLIVLSAAYYETIILGAVFPLIYH